MGACFQTFVAKGHASALLQLAARCDSGSPRFISVGEGREGNASRAAREIIRGRKRGGRPSLLSCRFEEDAPPPPSTLLLTALHLLCLVLSPSRWELSLLRVSGRRVIVEIHRHKTLVLAMTSTYNLDFHPLAESRLMTSGDAM